MSRINHGMVVLLGVAKGDAERDVRYMLEKIPALRIFGDQQGKMNLSLAEVGGSALVVSQFTLLGTTDKGRRPGFEQAAPPETARALYDQVVVGLRDCGLHVETGIFGVSMLVSLENEGPVTFILDSQTHLNAAKQKSERA